MNYGSGSTGGAGSRHGAHGSVSSVSSTPFMTPSGLADGERATTPTSGGGLRKERGAIAAQACDTCRSRKQKCDEQRPQCGTCQKFKLACHYREPLPTKKDKTLGEILDRLKTLERKIDRLSVTDGRPVHHADGHHARADDVDGFAGSSSLTSLSDLPQAPQPQAQPPQPQPPQPQAPQAPPAAYCYSPSTYQMLGWPIVQQLLAHLEPHTLPSLPSLASEGETQSLFLGLHHEPALLPMATAVPSRLPPAHWEGLCRLCNAYFDTFNCFSPVVDRTTFFSTNLPAVVDNGGTAAPESACALAFLVLALGEVALAETSHEDKNNNNNENNNNNNENDADTDASRPQRERDAVPGLGFFNKARQLMGYVLGECTLAAVQVHALAGVFCSTCLRHMDCWRYTTMASLSCQALITSRPHELHAPHTDVIRRVFWHCLIVESHYHMELGLPLTGLERFEHTVGLPDFGGPYSHDDYLANEASHFQQHYASQIVLRRLGAAFHDALRASTRPEPAPGQPSRPMTPATPATPADRDADPGAQQHTPYPVAAHHMAVQLDNWRGMLPPSLQWPHRAAAVPYDDLSPSRPAGRTGAPGKFMPGKYMLPMQSAVLRTRYYYNQYLVHKPFLFRALHCFRADQLSPDDARGAAACLLACLRWPLTMPPASTHKRMVPCAFFTTQTVLGVLIVLRVAQQAPGLAHAKALVSSDLDGDEGYDHAAQDTARLCMAWLRDLSVVDRAAQWAWELVKGMYYISE